MEVWKRQLDGSWKAVADTYNSDLPTQPQYSPSRCVRSAALELMLSDADDPGDFVPAMDFDGPI
jgi:hypothetical protein